MQPDEHPILFAGRLVRAILEGRKTVTRRTRGLLDFTDRGRLISCRDGVAAFGDSIPDDPVPIDVRCPYGKPGDLLWVRETLIRGDGGHIKYAADDSLIPHSQWQWKRPSVPSIHMPRWASRITLKVESVRVERLQDITEADARAEGAERGRPADAPVNVTQTYRDGFLSLWDHINGKRAPWKSNPWVWSITFRVASATAKETKRSA